MLLFIILLLPLLVGFFSLKFVFYYLGGLVCVWFFAICIDCRIRNKKEGCAKSYYVFLIAPINVFLHYMLTPDLRVPFPSMSVFHKENGVLAANWKAIREEAIRASSNAIPTKDFYISVKKRNSNWKTVPLYWYEKSYVENMAKCPETVKLLRSLPNVQGALFSIVPPQARIYPHVGPWKGCIRYHLGLVVPKESSKCFIIVDGIRYSWKEGEGVLFDDTYLHSVANNTDETRIVLFLDVERPLKYKWAQWILHHLNTCGLAGYLSTKNSRNEKIKIRK